MKKLILSLLMIYLFRNPTEVSADSYVVTTSAEFEKYSFEEFYDPRIIKLEKYLKKHNSPLSEYANVLIWYADEQDLDWRLIPAISGVESTFGKRIPKNSYNAYGWANGNYSFVSWDDSIGIVAKTLREKYYDKGADDINKIARRYAPPSDTWAWKVKFFMNEIDSVPVEFDL